MKNMCKDKSNGKFVKQMNIYRYGVYILSLWKE